MAKKGAVLGYFLIVILAIFIYFSVNQTHSVKKEFEPQKVVIEEGEGLKDIAQNLQEAGLIKNKKFFEMYAYLKNVKNKFWPGEYFVSPDMSLKEIIQILTDQSKAKAPEKVVTIIEGWTLNDIGNYLSKENIVDKTDFFDSLSEISQNNDYEFLNNRPNEASLEGYLFPDTYRIYEKTTARAIINKMLDNFGEKLDARLRAKIKEQNKTIFEIITMASLVEKEASKDSDRRIIAGIFWKRLANDMPLQSCASINYILGKTKEKISLEDTHIESPYNTYMNRGLPPGPIDNPSLNAIEATIEPIKTDYWYFLATSQGDTIFAKTLEEHNQNKAKYLK